MFSATVSKPIARLAQNYQKNAVRVNTVSLEETHSDIDYQALSVMPADTEKAIINLLLYHDAPNAIVFCSRRDAVNRLASRLTNRGFSVVALSGEFSQKERSNSVLAMRDKRARVCVATDVAARGLDLPGLDLVIHADLPRNKEALLHRSGRTGRAGRRGVCALIVPVKARRRTERLFQEAKVDVTWTLPPSASDIETALDKRLLTNDVLKTPANEDEENLANALLEAFPPTQLAAAIIRLTRAKDSAPEVLQAPDETHDRNSTVPPKGSYDPDKKTQKRKSRARDQADLENGQWIKLGVGRKNHADPKWLIPMLCKTGGFSRNAIGNIQIGPDKTLVELTPKAASQVMAAAGKAQIIDKSIWVGLADGPDGGAEPQEPVTRRQRKKPAHRKGSRPKSKTNAKPKAGANAKAGAKPKAPRAGPKKPRGPNGGKKRGAKKPQNSSSR